MLANSNTFGPVGNVCQQLCFFPFLVKGIIKYACAVFSQRVLSPFASDIDDANRESCCIFYFCVYFGTYKNLLVCHLFKKRWPADPPYQVICCPGALGDE